MENKRKDVKGKLRLFELKKKVIREGELWSRTAAPVASFGGGGGVGRAAQRRLAVATATTWAPRTRLRLQPAEGALGPLAMGPPAGLGSVVSHLLKQGLSGPVHVSRSR